MARGNPAKKLREVYSSAYDKATEGGPKSDFTGGTAVGGLGGAIAKKFKAKSKKVNSKY
jgi:hypothetical protein